MRYRQVHLDFHTSELLEGIGKKFDKKQFQEALQIGHVNSINIFAKCHHGYSYYPSEVNEMHPGLDFDLLGQMKEAAEEIGVLAPIYVSAGLDEKEARRHPEWLIRNRDESTRWTPNFYEPGYHEFCFNTPYLDGLLKHIEEVVVTYHPVGLWLDIVGVRPCYCQACVAKAKERGIDPYNPVEMEQIWEETYKNYQKRVAECVGRHDSEIGIFHNSGHFARGREDLWMANTHYELESLPTGGWSYDHFPLSARYIQGFGKDFLGMTGKFHTSWGEFGGFKHPNALCYEVALDLMNGAKCSIGDQLHPNGEMDLATYRLIGEAFKEVEEKEAWCDHVTSIADIGLFSAEVIEGTKMMSEFNNLSDSGAARMLFEGKYLFDVIDMSSDFMKYKVIILPDKIRLCDDLKDKLDFFTAKGGVILATGESGLGKEENQFMLNLGVEFVEKNQYSPAYIRPEMKQNNIDITSYVVYQDSYIVNAIVDNLEGNMENPFYNREPGKFCSHQHFPTSHKNAGAGIVYGEQGCYVAFDIFKEYALTGSIICRKIIVNILETLLEGKKTLTTSLPVQGLTSLMHQKEEKRYINHFTHAIPVMRGKNTNIIEEITPVYNVDVELQLDTEIKRVYLAPENVELEFKQEGNWIQYQIPNITCHQMVVLDYKE